MRGRKPKPDMLKRLHGTFQACRARRSPEAPEGPLRPSEQLARLKYGLEIWSQVIAAAPLGLLRPIDVPFLESLCCALALARDATDQLIEAGGPNPYDGRSKILLRIVNQQTDIARKLLADLALTPQARHFLE
jgi:hypothetical protein